MGVDGCFEVSGPADTSLSMSARYEWDGDEASGKPVEV